MLPTCSEVVPEQLRSTVYAFDRSFEGAIGATAAPLVGAHWQHTWLLGDTYHLR
jgi:hypothetical protein